MLDERFGEFDQQHMQSNLLPVVQTANVRFVQPLSRWPNPAHPLSANFRQLHDVPLPVERICSPLNESLRFEQIRQRNHSSAIDGEHPR
jgi:hypothetical protein